MLALGAQHNDPDAPIGVERLESRAQLLALGHRYDVERRPVENNVSSLPRAPGPTRAARTRGSLTERRDRGLAARARDCVERDRTWTGSWFSGRRAVSL